MLKQLTEQDASFLYLETVETPEHVGGLNLVELPPDYQGDFFEKYKATIRSRMHLVPFLRAKLAQAPFQLDRPFWVNDDHVDIDYHVRRETVPQPGGMAQLEQLVGRLHTALLDRTRPLWEFYVIEGLASGPAIYTKIHHAAMDGASSQALVCTMYDPSPEPRVFPPARADQHEEKPDLAHMAEGMLAHFIRQEIRALRAGPELLKAFTQALLPDPETLRYQQPAPTPRSPHTLFNVGITNQRTYTARTLPLSGLKQIAKRGDVKLNDVVLAVCSGALRHYLLEKNGLPQLPLTASIPVAVRATADENTPNQNGMFLCSLATDQPDPKERLAAIHASTSAQKQRFQSLRGLTTPDISLPGEELVLKHLVELYGHSRASQIPLLGNVTISNVPGPPIPLYIAGARVVSLYPCSIPFHGAALNITAQSYTDRLDFGLIACRRAVPDLAYLGDLLLAAYEELHEAMLGEHVAHVTSDGPAHTQPSASAARVSTHTERTLS